MRDRAVSLKMSLVSLASRALGTLYALVSYFRGERVSLRKLTIFRFRRRGREAEGGGLLRLSRFFRPPAKFPNSLNRLNLASRAPPRVAVSKIVSSFPLNGGNRPWSSRR